MFIDCNCLEASRPGGGPTESGANAARWDPLIQQAYYNGWKSVHGLKHQTVDSAFGLAIDIFGPTSLRKNDVTLLRESKINERVQRECQTLDYEYAIFGDSAYRTYTHLRSYMPSNSIETRRWNGRIKSVQISIEWSHMATASLFKYVRNHETQMNAK